MAKTPQENTSLSKKQRWLVGLLPAGVVLVLVLLWVLPDIVVSKDVGAGSVSEAARLQAKGAVRQGILWAAGGIIAIVTLFLTWKRDSVNRARVDLDRSRAALEEKRAELDRSRAAIEEKRAELDRDANFTSRYTEAIAQLGHESITIRLGGIYALERIANESDSDRPTIVNVLTALLRHNSPLSSTSTSALPIDLAAAVTVVGRISGSLPEGQVPNLRFTNLQGADFRRARLAAADLAAADLTEANLTGANLTGATLTKATLTRARLTKATLTKARLSGATLTRANLTKANLTEARLTVANLTASTLTKAEFAEAELAAADFTGARLTGANLTGANLTEAHLAAADFTGARLTGANLTGANLTGANLTKARLTGANLTGANLTRATLNGAFYDDQTRWPSGFDFSSATKVKASQGGDVESDTPVES